MTPARFMHTGDDGPDPVLEEAAAIERWADAGAPSASEMSERLHGDAPEPPLTVKQAVKRTNLSDKTIRRRLPTLAAMDPPGAWKEGRVWRIDPAALDASRAPVPDPAPAPSGRRPRRARASRGPESTRWEV